MTAEDSFLSAIRASPRDDAPRLIFADWLEERGDLRGEYLRTEVALTQLEEEPAPKGLEIRWDRRRNVRRLRSRLAELQPLLDLAWLEVVHRGLVLYCNRFLEPGAEGRCPGRWELLRETPLPRLRRCAVCLRSVALCRSEAEVAEARRFSYPLVLTPTVDTA